MELEELEEPIQSIITLVKKIDAQYQEKCFEILLEYYLKNELKLIPKSSEEGTPDQDKPEENEYQIPIDVRAFLSQHQIPEDILGKLFLIQQDAIRPIYTITTTRKLLLRFKLLCYML